MNRRQMPEEHGPRGRRAALRASGVVVSVLTFACGALAQSQVPQTGRLFEVNPRVDGGGLNYSRSPYALPYGNALTQGMIGRGLSLRPISPIADPTAFRGPMFSAALGGFMRDSVSVADAFLPARGLLPTPYYDPSRTVVTPGFLSGQTVVTVPNASGFPVGSRSVPTMPPPAAGGPLDLRMDTRLPLGPVGVGEGGGPALPGLRSQIAGLRPGSTPELASTIFGPTGAPLPAPGSFLEDPRIVNLSRPQVRFQRDFSRAQADLEADLPEPPGSRAPLGTPLEFVRSGEPIHLRQGEEGETAIKAAEWRALRAPRPEEVDPAGIAGRVLPPRSAPDTPTLSLRDASILPGYDLFTDIQIARALAADPSAAWFAEMQAAARDNPMITRLLGDITTMQAQEFIARVMQAPITTFHGRGESPVNNELLKAESLLEIGEYYEAVRRFDAAHRLDPLNPLPLIGKGHAYLAAGEYASAATALVQGFERYPELSRLKFDLRALMGGGEVVDIRRADLLRRLANQETAELRFLLGYLEYYAGNMEFGLRHFERAAEQDASGSIIARFPAMLRDQGRLPPPKLPGDVRPPPAPDGPQR